MSDIFPVKNKGSSASPFHDVRNGRRFLSGILGPAHRWIFHRSQGTIEGGYFGRTIAVAQQLKIVMKISVKLEVNTPVQMFPVFL